MEQGDGKVKVSEERRTREIENAILFQVKRESLSPSKQKEMERSALGRPWGSYHLNQTVYDALCRKIFHQILLARKANF